MQPNELKFEKEAIRFIQLAEKTNKCIYLTGKAWAWKSTLINFFISKTKKKFIMLWTTWVSAEKIGGETIHRFFWLQKGWRVSINNEKRDIIRETDIFIIDEISMMRADLFDKLEWIMRNVMQNEYFFWWKQFIFVWDLFQLPPVPEQEFFDKNKTQRNPYYDIFWEKYKGLFFFDWNNYNQEHFEKIQLRKVYRQTDIDFVDMLNRVRLWDGSREVLNYFNQKYIDKKDIHPQYFPKAQVKCACGNSFTVGSTKEFIEVEICSKCHPFYSGKEKIVDALGRVEKFRKRLAKKTEISKKKKK